MSDFSEHAELRKIPKQASNLLLNKDDFLRVVDEGAAAQQVEKENQKRFNEDGQLDEHGLYDAKGHLVGVDVYMLML